MSEAYIEYTYNDCKTNPKIVKKIETAVRKLFSAIVGFINKVKALPMYISNAKQKLKSELLEEQVKISGILKELSLNLKGVRSGPNRRSLNEIMVACPELVITKNVMSCGDHLELMTRAFLSLGLITDLHAVEPGSREANLGQSLSRD